MNAATHGAPWSDVWRRRTTEVLLTWPAERRMARALVGAERQGGSDGEHPQASGWAVEGPVPG